MNWRDITEYNAEMGKVVVWLQWSESYQHTGSWQTAYQVATSRNGNIWVDAAACTPLETTGRRVTHFLRPQSPDSASEQ